MKHSVGIIGLGTVGSRFVEQFNLHGSFDLKAAWDPDPAACKANEKEVRIAESASAVIEEADVAQEPPQPGGPTSGLGETQGRGVGLFAGGIPLWGWLPSRRKRRHQLRHRHGKLLPTVWDLESRL